MCDVFMLVYCVVFVSLYLVFLFFKQKTAYEMRISDWSSDVCSSDLRLEAIVAMAEALDADRLEVAHVQYYGWALRNRAALMPTRNQVAAATSKIGRASCRERVCQYV